MSDDMPRDWLQMNQKTLRTLAAKKTRQTHSVYLLEGTSAIRDAITLGHKPHLILYDSRVRERDADQEAFRNFQSNRLPLKELKRSELTAISGLKSPQPFIAIFPQAENLRPSLPVESGLVLALDQVSDPGNVGTLIRSAAFFGLEEVWIGEGSADLYNMKTLRAAMGAHLHVRICQNVDLGSVLKRLDSKTTGVFASILEDAEEPRTLKSYAFDSAILLLGNEPRGLSTSLIELATNRVAIPRRGQVDSLNVAIAGSLLLDRLLASS